MKRARRQPKEPLLRTLARWLGFLLVAGGIASFPFVIWFRGPWGVLTLLIIAAGCLLLLAGIRRGDGSTFGSAQEPDEDVDTPDR